MLAGHKGRHIAGFAFDTVERRQQFNGGARRDDEPIRVSRFRQLPAGSGVAEIAVHEAVTVFEIEVESVEHPPGSRECLQFAARITQDFPERNRAGSETSFSELVSPRQ